MKRRIINVVSNTNFESRKTKAYLLEKLNEYGFHVPKYFDESAELTICIGGDGAFLKAVHRNGFPDTPIIGINTGHLGFFQEVMPEKIDEFLDNYIAGNYKEEKIYLTGAVVYTRGRKFYLTAINEIVVKCKGSKVIHLDIFINRMHLQKFSGDGVIISTPVGSTGYNYSVGGAILHPSIEALQIASIAPINSSAFRTIQSSIVVPGNQIITLKPEQRYTNSSIIIVDGNEISYSNLTKINFKISNKIVRRLVLNSDYYWTNLKGKFL